MPLLSPERDVAPRVIALSERPRAPRPARSNRRATPRRVTPWLGSFSLHAVVLAAGLLGARLATVSVRTEGTSGPIEGVLAEAPWDETEMLESPEEVEPIDDPLLESPYSEIEEPIDPFDRLDEATFDLLDEPPPPSQAEVVRPSEDVLPSPRTPIHGRVAIEPTPVGPPPTSAAPTPAPSPMPVAPRQVRAPSPRPATPAPTGGGGGGLRPVRAPDPPPPAGRRAPRARITVVVLLTVEADGGIRSAQVHTSSGDPIFDGHACAWAEREWRYPATGRAFRTLVPFHLDP